MRNTLLYRDTGNNSLINIEQCKLVLVVTAALTLTNRWFLQGNHLGTPALWTMLVLRRERSQRLAATARRPLTSVLPE